MAFGLTLFSKVRRMLVGRAATSDYKQIRFEAFTKLRDLPLFTFEFARHMLLDPTVRLGIAMRAAPISQAQFGHMERDDKGNSKFVPGVRADDDLVAAWVEKQLERIWINELHKITAAQVWGWSAGEVVYKYNDTTGYIDVDKFLKRSAIDTLALIGDGEIGGVRFKRIENRPDGIVDLKFPKCFWHSFDSEDEHPYGLSVLRGAFSPWADKWLQGGALDVRRLFMHKDAYGGMDIGYPPGVTEINGQIIPNRDIAREMVEQIKAGGVVTRPSTRGPDGQEQWPIQWAKVPANPMHILEFPKQLDTEILRGLEIPDDVLLSDATGAWQGKQVPMLAFFTNADRWLNQIVAMIVKQILEPMVLINFGKAANFEVRTKPLAEQMMEQMNEDGADEPQMGVPVQTALPVNQPPANGQQQASANGNGQLPPLPQPVRPPARLSLAPDVNIAEQLVGMGTIQAHQLITAAKQLNGRNELALSDREMTAEDIADIFEIDPADLLVDDPFEDEGDD